MRYEKRCCRVGEAKKPGPNNTLENYFTKVRYGGVGIDNGVKADKPDQSVVQWCVSKGYSMRRVEADGDCLYSALGVALGMRVGECRQFIADAASRVWDTVMDHDVHKVELAPFIRRTLSRGVWGGAEQVAVCAEAADVTIHVHELNETVHAFGCGKQVIRLLYSNCAAGRGEPDHYDLIWPKSQTGEGKLAYAECGGAIPYRGEGVQKRDHTRSNGNDTRICTVNVSGSYEFFCNALDIEADVIMVQEHWRTEKTMGTWKAAALRKGWHGVWGVAERSGKGSPAAGVAILVKTGRHIFAIKGAEGPRFLGGVVSWTRRVKMHLYTVYGHTGTPAAAQKNRVLQRTIGGEISRLGRVPWVIGGDWNATPDEVCVGNVGGAAMISTETATHEKGRILDWFLTNMDIDGGTAVEAKDDAGVTGHLPVIMTIKRKIKGDLGTRLRRPRAFEGVTKADIKDYTPEKGERIDIGGTLDQQWRQWNDHAERHLMSKEGLDQKEYTGRGARMGRVENTTSAPQMGEDGIAGTGEVKAILTDLNKLQRYKYLQRSQKDDTDEAKVLRSRLGAYEDYGEAIIDLQARLDKARKEVETARAERWKKWAKETWSTRKKHIYRWAAGKTRAANDVKMSVGDSGADITDRLKRAVEAWSAIWNDSEAGAYVPKFGDVLPPITGERVRSVINKMPDGKSKGYDSWAPNELRALTDAHMDALAELLNNCEDQGRWPRAMGKPIIALIPKKGAESEGQMRPIALLPYVYRVWMCVRKADIQDWVSGMHGGGFKSAESLAWELAARGEAARLMEHYFMAAFLDCSKCYERIGHDNAHDSAVRTGCNSTIANMAMEMYARPRILQAHGSHSDDVEVNRGILAGCGFAVHFLKAIIGGIIGDVDVSPRDFVDDIVLHSCSSNQSRVALDMSEAIEKVTKALEEIHQVLNKEKEQLLIQNAGLKKLWKKIEPDYQGSVGSSAKDLGVAIRPPWEASVNRETRIAEAVPVIKRIGILPFAVPDKTTVIKSAGLARTHYGVATDPINIRQYRAIRGVIKGALWGGKTSSSPTTSLLLADKGELEPWTLTVKRTMANWVRQLSAGLPNVVIESWNDLPTGGNRSAGPVDGFKRILKDLGWSTQGPDSIKDEGGFVRRITEWKNFAVDAVYRARQVLWQKAGASRGNYDGAQEGVDERTTGAIMRKMFKKRSQEGRSHAHCP